MRVPINSLNSRYSPRSIRFLWNVSLLKYFQAYNFASNYTFIVMIVKLDHNKIRLFEILKWVNWFENPIKNLGLEIRKINLLKATSLIYEVNLEEHDNWSEETLVSDNFEPFIEWL